MRILISGVSRFTTPSGICRAASNLAQALAPHAEVTLAVGAWQEDYFRRDFGLDGDAVRLRGVAIPNTSLGRNRWYLGGLEALVRDAGADVLHAAYPIPLRRRHAAAATAGTVHDLYPFDAPENFGFPQHLLVQAAFRRFLRTVDGVACVSEQTSRRLHELFPRDAARVAPVVVHNTVAPVATSAQPAAIGDAPFLLAVAQHRTNKNLAALLRAFAALGLAGTTLVVVGSPGPETPALHALVDELGLRDDVRFLHDLSDPELRWAYEHARVLVAPSLHEGFGLAPVEAATYGCPSVVSDLPVFREVAPPDATFVDPGSPEAIAAGIRSALAGPRPSPGTPEAYRPATAARAHVALYERLLSARG